MAGIGFELRKIYNEDSLFSKQKVNLQNAMVLFS